MAVGFSAGILRGKQRRRFGKSKFILKEVDWAGARTYFDGLKDRNQSKIKGVEA